MWSSRMRSFRHAGNFLWMLTGEKPSETATKAFDMALILHADHELNASTFAARVIAATLADVHSAITGAIGALKGPLHGGANEAVMRMLFEIDKEGRGPGRVCGGMLGAEEEGFRIRASRVSHRGSAGDASAQDVGGPGAVVQRMRSGLRCRRAIEKFVKAEKKLNANVDFYSASTYTTLGIDLDLFTPIFAVSRIAGWAAHVIEQLDDNRLIRPRAEYIGPEYPVKYLAVEKR